jgi:hypothetical protein
MANECRAVSGMRIGRGTEILVENPTQYNFEHQRSHMTASRIKLGPPVLKPGV